MSRRASGNPVSGARERLVLARELLTLLQEQRQAGGSHGRLLALRGATIHHAYAALVSLLQQAANAAGVANQANQTSLPALERAFEEAGVQAPELALLMQARTHHDDLVFWLEQQLMALYAPAGLARRLLPHQHGHDDGASLTVVTEDPYAPLQDEDLARLDATLHRVAALIRDCAAYSAEW